MKRKTILAAGYVRDILFSQQDDLDLYLYALDRSGVEYEILDKLQRDDGSIIIRILQQYNQAPLIRLYNED